jgi:hypothetical protein
VLVRMRFFLYITEILPTSCQSRKPPTARKVRDANLETRTARLRLAIRAEPYWRTIDPGAHLGYYRGKRGGTWAFLGSGR